MHEDPVRRPVWTGSLVFGAAAALALLALHQPLAAAALALGVLVGLLMRWHASSMLARAMSRPSALVAIALQVTAIARVFIAGVAPFAIFRNAGIGVYAAYLVGIVAPTAVAAFALRQMPSPAQSATTQAGSES